jgi:hypothetical protein
VSHALTNQTCPDAPPPAATVDLPGAGTRLFRGPHGLVPYIANWSSEDDTTPVIASPTGIGYADEHPLDRDTHGVLWSRFRTTPGQGEPQYDSLHPLRQRRAMRRLLCQVCAAPADHNEDGTLWVLNDGRGTWSNWPVSIDNAQPPVCRRCARLAIRSCPALHRNWIALRAHSHVTGVFGDHFTPTPNGLRRTSNTVHTYDQPGGRWIQAGQLVRVLIHPTIEDL